jgi:hypothetical protein
MLRIRVIFFGLLYVSVIFFSEAPPIFQFQKQTVLPCSNVVRNVVVIDDEPNFFREVQGFLVSALRELSFFTRLMSREDAFGFNSKFALDSFAPCNNESIVCFWLTPCAQSRRIPGTFTWDIPANPVLVNLEVLSRSTSKDENREFDLLCIDDTKISNMIWPRGPTLDYLHGNVDILGPTGLALSPNVQYMKLRYYPGIAYYNMSPIESNFKKIYDVLFIGAPNHRRNWIIDELRKDPNIRVEVVYRHMWGPLREEIVRQSRIVINLHYYEKNFETVRLFWLLSLGAFVITEADTEINSRVMEEYKGSIVFSTYSNFVETVKKYLEPDMETERLKIATRGYEFIRKETPGEVLRPLLESAWGCGF